MELSINISYNQILRLIRQLPVKDIKKLTDTLQSEITSDKSEETLQNLILQAPTWSDSEFYDFNEARTHINKSRLS